MEKLLLQFTQSIDGIEMCQHVYNDQLAHDLCLLSSVNGSFQWLRGPTGSLMLLSRQLFHVTITVCLMLQ